jgi:hypothetical protein
MGDHRNPDVVQQMKRKHPSRKKDIRKLTEAELEFSRKGINRDVFDLKHRQLKHAVAPGFGCLRSEHILALILNPHRQVTPSAQSAVGNLFNYGNAIVHVKMPDYFYEAWVTVRLVPANKADPDNLPPGTVPDCRPVNLGNAERRMITRAYFDEKLQLTYDKILGPVQNGVGIKDGISITAFGVLAAMEAAPGVASIQDDIKNGYNKVKKESVMKEMKGCGKLDNIVAFMQILLEPSAYIGMGKETNLVTAPFKMEEGVQQGAVESGWLFSFGANPACQWCNRLLVKHGGAITAIVNDNYINRPPAQAFEANRIIAEDLNEVGLELEPVKSKCHLDAAHRDNEWDRMRDGIPNGVPKTAADEVVMVNGSPVYGMTVCNVPARSQEFVEG